MSSKSKQYRPNVGIMLLNHDGQVFVAQRIDTPGSAWQMPQGGIDDGETPSQAVIRELKEEIGTDHVEIIIEAQDWLSYDLPIYLQNKLWGGHYIGQKQKWFLMRFLGQDQDINLQTEHPEFSDWKWVSPDQLPSLAIDFKKKIYEEVLVLFKHYI
jgi:putative (di)nucleoside polyphosphate hydrolase